MWRLGVLVCVACADNDYHCPGSGQQVIEVCVDSPTFVAYRDGDSDWQTPVMSNGVAKLCVNDDYVLETVYTGSNGLGVTSIASTVAETTPTIQTCAQPPAAAPVPIVNVTGVVAQLGEVWIDWNFMGTGTEGVPPWAFSLGVPAGIYDVVAVDYDTPVDIVIRRAQPFETATAEPEIDLGAEGTPMTQVPLAITGLVDGDVIGTTVDLTTKTTYASYVSQTSSATADVVPASLLEPTDEQDLTVSAGQGPFEYDRYLHHDASTAFTGTETSFALMPYIAGVTFSSGPIATATWTSLPTTYTTVSMDQSVVNVTTFTLSQIYASATKGWIDLHGATSLGFDTSAPGYDPSWNVGSNYEEFLEVDDNSTSISYESYVSQIVGP